MRNTALLRPAPLQGGSPPPSSHLSPTRPCAKSNGITCRARSHLFPLASRQRDGELLVGCDVGGFYRSTDGGASYTISNAGLQDYFVECIVPDPLDPNVIYLGCESGVYKSADRGGTWQWLRQGFPPKSRWDWTAPIGALTLDPRDPASSGQVRCITVDANDPDVLYFGTGGNGVFTGRLPEGARQGPGRPLRR
jgi:hypothetical protein